ncbi:MAG: hypothetical protein KJ623_02690 [Nanoarchaeota archaeon]|nr:hypothetical protein [Nanoarchaeota archaeon]MBU0963395.1 hypothetical protein [Nanoarchaeota archaeon]
MKKNTIIAIIVFVALISIFVGTIIYYGNIIKEGYHYTYKGADGSDYAIEVIRLEGVKGLFQRVTFALSRDDGKLYKYSTLFRNSPMDLEKIPMEPSRDSILYNGNDAKTQIYITQDTSLPGNSSRTSTVAALDIMKLTYGLSNVYIYGVPTELAYMNITPEQEQMEIKDIDCSDASDEIGVILIKLGSENKIYKENDNCVVLEAKSYDDITKVTDKFNMHLIGIF